MTSTSIPLVLRSPHQTLAGRNGKLVKGRLFSKRWPAVASLARLLGMVVAVTAPVAVWMVVETAQAWQAEHARFEVELKRQTSLLARSIDQEMQASAQALTFLTYADALQRDDVVGFFGALATMPRLRQSWRSVFLVAPNGELIFNTNQPMGKPLGSLADTAVLSTLRQQGRMVSTGVMAAPDGAPMSGILVPVIIKGQVRYALGAWVSTQGWRSLLEAGATPHREADQLIHIVDAQWKPVARSGGGDGKWPSALVDRLMDQIRQGVAGSAGDQTLASSDVLSAWQGIGQTGWRVIVSESDRQLVASQWHDVVSTVVACVLSMLLATWLIWRVGRYSVEPEQVLETPPEGPRDGLTPGQVSDLAHATDQVGFFHVNLDVNQASWTPGLSTLLALPPTRCTGKWSVLTARLHPHDKRVMIELVKQAVKGMQDRVTIESRILIRDKGLDHERWLSSRVSIAYVHHAASHPEISLTGMVIDVTQQRHLDQERAHLVAIEKQARMEAERANRAKDEFLAMLGHELRNPLGAISAACEVLNRADPGQEVAVRARQIIARQTNHLARLMDDLLDVFRVISGKVLLVRSPLLLGQLVQRVVHTLELAGHLRAHQLTVQLDDVWVYADAMRIEQVINNLLSNAVKYTPEQGHIEVGVKACDGEAVLQVRDSGVGMSAELMARVFDMFVQGERTMDRPQGGLGIGLTLVRRLVELHGGKVEVQSGGMDKGSLFTVRLPLARAMDEPSKDRRPNVARDAHRVVVVEDNDDAREALCAMLTLSDHEIHAAQDGQGGLELILRIKPDVALIDIGLPGLTGYQVAQKLRAAGYSGCLVALSGYGQPADVDRAHQSGFNDHLVKPVDSALLEKILHQAPHGILS